MKSFLKKIGIPFKAAYKKVEDKKLVVLLRESAKEFGKKNVIKYCAALSYYTMFSLAPMLMLIIILCGFLFGREAIEGQLFYYIKDVVGVEASVQIQEIVKNISLQKSSVLATIAGFITFFIGATGVFGEVQSTINTIWGLKAKPKKGFIRYVVNRLLSFAMILTIGFLLLVSMVASTVISYLGDTISTVMPESDWLIIIMNNVIAITIITLLFTLIFKYLPDAVIRWRDALAGAIFTSVLFMLGKFFISLYMAGSTSHSIYGAAGAIIVVAVWIYYSSILLYFGAVFTKINALNYGKGILPSKYSVRVVMIEKQEDDQGHEKKQKSV